MVTALGNLNRVHRRAEKKRAGAFLWVVLALTTAWSTSASGQTDTSHSLLGFVESADIVEASGLVFSLLNPGVLYVHNDRGDSSRVFAIDLEGNLLATLNLIGIPTIDPEDMASAFNPDTGRYLLFLGDIGDNQSVRTKVSVFRFEEPDISLEMRDVEMSITEVDTLDYLYPDGAKDAEALLTSPDGQRIYIISKQAAEVYRGSASAGLNNLTHLGSMPYSGVTGATRSSTGNEILIRRYPNVLRHRAYDDGGIESTLATSAAELSVEPERQGEAIALSPDGATFVTISEGSFQPINGYTFLTIHLDGFESGALERW